MLGVYLSMSLLELLAMEYTKNHCTGKYLFFSKLSQTVNEGAVYRLLLDGNDSLSHQRTLTLTGDMGKGTTYPSRCPVSTGPFLNNF